MNAFRRAVKSADFTAAWQLDDVLDYLLALVAALHGGSSNGAGKTSHATGRAVRTNSSETQLLEYRRLYEEFGKLKKIVDIVRNDYEESKRYEVFRRYNRLKGLIKRTVTYTKLDVLPDISHALGIGSLAAMTAPGIRKPVVIVPECPKSELSERIHTLKKRIAFVRAQIEQLEESYQQSKQYIPVQRYRLMKSMVKQLLTNCIDLLHNQ